MLTGTIKLNEPLLAIGFTKDDWDETTRPISSQILLELLQLKETSLEGIKFHIVALMSFRKYETHSEIYELTEARSNSDLFKHEELSDADIIFINTRLFTRGYAVNDWRGNNWRIENKDSENNPAKFRKRVHDLRIPLYYTSLSTFLTSIHSIKSKDLIDIEYKEIFDILKEEFNAWDIIYDVNKVMVKLKDGVSFGDEAGGPTTSLPGQEFSIKKLTLCDDHPNRLAVKRIVGECDSFSCENLHLCQQCYDEYKAHVEDSNSEQYCEWCKKIKDDVGGYRDPEEGSCGPVYEVCGDCIKKNNDYIFGDDL